MYTCQHICKNADNPAIFFGHPEGHTFCNLLYLKTYFSKSSGIRWYILHHQNESATYCI